jgi:protein-tyrosine-phosphatase/peptidoglycan/xylan/chitin deacetylase (PgdA/CDA1 family)
MAFSNERSILRIATNIKNVGNNEKMEVEQSHCRVLMLHRIANPAMGISGIETNWLNESIDLFLKKGFRFLSLEEFKHHIASQTPFPDNALLVTIDDGYADQVNEMVPAFLKHGIKPAVFLISKLIEQQELPWDESIRYIAEHTAKPYIYFDHLGGKLHYYFDTRENKTWARRDFIARCELLDKKRLAESIDSFAQAADVEIPKATKNGFEAASLSNILRLSKQGASFSSHTDSHLILASNDDQTCLQAIYNAKPLFENNEFETECFAYPIGKDHSIINKLNIPKEAGFILAFTTVEGIANHQCDAYAITRISYPLNEKQLEEICSPLALYRYDRSNWLIKLHNLRKLKILINAYGGKAASLTWLKHQLKLFSGRYQKYRKLDMDSIKRVVFFCKGNINRSAIAEAVFATSSDRGHASFGLKTEQRFPPSVEAQRWARKNSLAILHHKTTRAEDFAIEQGDLLIAFEPEQLQFMEKQSAHVAYVQYSLLGLWADNPWAYIHDPVARPKEYFDKCFSIIENATRNLAKALEAKPK